MNDKKIRLPNILVTIAFTIIVFGLGVLYYNQTMSKQRGIQNNAYIRVTNCILTTPPAIRDQKKIDDCYTQVENDLHVTLLRYNNTK